MLRLHRQSWLKSLFWALFTARLNRPKRRGRGGRRSAQNFEALENRIALTSNLVVEATDSSPLLMEVVGGQLRVVRQSNPQTVVASQPLQTTFQALVTAGDFDVQLTIDVSVPSLPGGILFQGGGGKSILVAPNINNDWSITGAGTGTLSGRVQFSGIKTLAGGSADDVYRFAPGGQLGSLILDEAAGGTDTLDFSATGGGVTVDLSNSAAQAIHGNLNLTLSSGETFENVLGGSGGDRITGNERNNLLIGGAGNDTLVGGGGDDTYVFGPGSGSDTITEEGGENGGLDKVDTSAISANTTVRKLSDGSYTLSAGGASIAFRNVENSPRGPGPTRWISPVRRTVPS